MIDRELVTRKLALITEDLQAERVHEAASSALRDVPEYLRLVSAFIERG